MSFDLNGLSEVRALNFGRRYHAYDTTDTLSEVLTPGYFDAGWYRLGARDRLDIEASDGRIMAVVSVASAAGVTITASTDVIPANALAPGSVARSVEDKLGDVLSVKDFGAVVDGYECDALAAGMPVATTVGTALTTSIDMFHSTIASSSQGLRRLYIRGNDGVSYVRYITARSAANAVTIDSALPADVTSAPIRLIYPLEGATITSGALSTLTIPSSSPRAFTSADVGKCIHVDCAGATDGGRGVHRTTIAAVVDSKTVTLTAACPAAVTAAPWAYGTDDGAALRLAHASQRDVIYPKGVTFSSVSIDMGGNQTVYAGGCMIKCHAFSSAGGFFCYKSGITNVLWIGGDIDIAGVGNMNAIAIGDVPNTARFVRNIRILGTTIRRARVDEAYEQNTSGVLFAGGGKGITAQFRAGEVIVSDCTIIDCDIGISIEAATTETRHVENLRFSNIVIKDSARCPLYLGGGIIDSSGSLAIEEYLDTKMPGATLMGITINGGCTRQVQVPGGSLLDNWAAVGAITCAYPSGVKLDCRIHIENRVTVQRGPIANCDFKIEFVGNDVENGWNPAEVETLTGSAAYYMPSNKYAIDMHCSAAANFRGKVFKGRTVSALASLRQSHVSGRLWGISASSITESGFFGVSCWYDFFDMGTTTRRVSGTSTILTTPSFAALGAANWVDYSRKLIPMDYTTDGTTLDSSVCDGRPIRNTGATGTVKLNLPVSVAGDILFVVRVAAQTFRLDPSGSEIVGSGGAGKYLSLDTTGGWVLLRCAVAGTWLVISSSGTISYEA